MDGLSLAAVCRELQTLVGGKVDKLQQPERDELLIGVYSGGNNYRLLISASPENCRVLLTDERKTSPIDAPVFLMLLRKCISGARIASVRQPNTDRVIEIEFDSYTELFEQTRYRLVCEIMGRHSNIILVDEDGAVVDAIRRVSPSVSSARLVLPKVRYEYAPSKAKLDPVSVDAERFSALLKGAVKPASALADAVYGLSPAIAGLLLTSVGYPADGADAAGVRLESFYRDLAEGVFRPVIVNADDGRAICTLPFIPVGEDFTEYASMSQAVESFYSQRAAQENVRRRTAAYERVIKNAMGKLERKLSIYADAISGDEDIERLRLFGELITANLHTLPRRASSAVVINYHADPIEMIEIPLDPLISPADNAQRYFQKSRKAKQAQAMAVKMRAEAASELDYLEDLLYTLSCCDGDAELNELRSELISGGYLHETPQSGRSAARMKQLASKPYEFVSRDGIAILVGKNNQQNDRLTLKMALPEEMWLHTKDIHGSHVIIRSRGDIPDASLYDAAMLAAYYSKARGSSNVPVDYTRVKYVKKPSGARPGMVVYTHQRTVYVTPSQEYAESLRR